MDAATREMLCQMLLDSLGREMRSLGDKIQQDVRVEFRRFIDMSSATLPLPPPERAAMPLMTEPPLGVPVVPHDLVHHDLFPPQRLRADVAEGSPVAPRPPSSSGAEICGDGGTGGAGDAARWAISLQAPGTPPPSRLRTNTKNRAAVTPYPPESPSKRNIFSGNSKVRLDKDFDEEFDIDCGKLPPIPGTVEHDDYDVTACCGDLSPAGVIASRGRVVGKDHDLLRRAGDVSPPTSLSPRSPGPSPKTPGCGRGRSVANEVVDVDESRMDRKVSCRSGASSRVASPSGRRTGRNSNSRSEVTQHVSIVQREIAMAASEMRLTTLRSHEMPEEHWSRVMIRRWVQSEYFDYIMGVFLLLNALFVGVQVNYMAQRPESKTPPLWVICTNITFCGIFIVELALRITVHGRHFWAMDGWKWNVFDTVVVAFTIIDELTQALMAGTSVQELIDQLGVLRMLRIGRVIRLIRMVRLIPELKSLVYLIMSSMGAFFWTLILMLILMYCVAVYFTQIATDIRGQVGASPEVDLILNYWGSIENSILSLFMAITGGDDWRNFSDVFTSHSGSFLNGLVFSCYIAWATLVMLNLVTGVFVEGAQRIVLQDRRKETLRLAARFFVDVDMDSSTELSQEEFEAVIQSRKLDEFFKGLGISITEANSLFRHFDEDGSGDISLIEFISGCLRLGTPAKIQDLVHMQVRMEDMIARTLKMESDLETVNGNLSRIDDMLRFIFTGGSVGRVPCDLKPYCEIAV